MNYIKGFLLMGLFGLSLNSFGQTLVGTWFYQAQNSTIVFYENGTFAAQSPTGQSSGYYGIVNNNILNFTDAYGNQMMYYTVNSLTNQQLNLTDPYNYNLIYVRQGQSPQNANTITQQNRPIPKAGNIDIPWDKPQYQTVLATSQGQQLLKSHVQIGVSLIQFIIAQKIKPSEIAELERSSIQEFTQYPTQFLEQINSIGQSMKQIYSITDPLQIGLARQQLFSALYLGSVNLPANQQPDLIKVMNRYANVLTYDTQNNLVLTEADLNGLVNYMVFMNQLSGNTTTVSNTELTAFKSQIVSSFQQMPLEQKQFLSSASLVWTLMEYNWNQMTPTQQQQMIASIQNSPTTPAPTYDNNNYDWVNTDTNTSNSNQKGETCWECFRIMQETMMDSHVTSMNIIENIGGTGNYWEVDYGW